MKINDKRVTAVTRIGDLKTGEIFLLNGLYYLKITDLNDVLSFMNDSPINCYNLSYDCLATLNVNAEIDERCENVTLNIE